MSTRGGLAALIFPYDHLLSNLTNVIPHDIIDVFRSLRFLGLRMVGITW
jgi:hypothetical protein